MNQFDNTPIQNQNAPAPQNRSNNEQIMAIASIIVGIIGLCAVFIGGICGAPFPIIGLVLGFLAMKDPNQKVLAIIGMVISGIALLLLCIALFVIGGLTIMGPVIGNVFSDINQSLQSVP